MWSVQEELNNPIDAKIFLGDSLFGKGLPKGTIGQKKNGFSFFNVEKENLRRGLYNQ